MRLYSGRVVAVLRAPFFVVRCRHQGSTSVNHCSAPPAARTSSSRDWDRRALTEYVGSTDVHSVLRYIDGAEPVAQHRIVAAFDASNQMSSSSVSSLRHRGEGRGSPEGRMTQNQTCKRGMYV